MAVKEECVSKLHCVRTVEHYWVIEAERTVNVHDMNGSQNIKLSNTSWTKKYMLYDSIYKNSRKDK